MSALAIAGGIGLLSAAPAQAWASKAGSATCGTFAGSSWWDNGGERVLASLGVERNNWCGWDTTGYVQLRKNPSGTTSPLNCTVSYTNGCSYIRTIAYGSYTLFYGGVHYYDNVTLIT